MKPNINFQLVKQLELPTETKKELTQGGIYRIYITNPKNQQQQSYIGISSNIFYRLTQHRRIINQLKENKKIKINKEEQQHLLTYFLEFYELEDISNNYAMYKKLQMKLTEFNLTYADIKIEILEFIKDYKNIDIIKIEAKEQEYIKQYNAEKQGLNDILNYKLKLAAAELTATPEQLEKIKKQEKDKKHKNQKMLINALKNNEQINEWLYWQIRVFGEGLDIEDGQKLLKKYKKTNEWSRYCKKIIKKIRNNAEVEIKKLLKELKQDYKKITNDYKKTKLKEQQLKHTKQQLKELNKDYKKLKELNKDYKKLKELNKDYKKLKELNKDYKKLKVKEQQLKHTKQQLKHTKQQLKELNKDYKKLKVKEQQLKHTKQQLKHTKQQLKELNKDYKKLKVKEQQLKQIKQQLTNDYKNATIYIKAFYKKIDYIHYKIYILEYNEQDNYIEQLNNFIEQIKKLF